MTALVTGGAGFIGSHLVEDLLAQGQTVIVIDDLSTGLSSNLAAVENNPNLTLLIWDVRDTQFLSRLLKGVDVVYHLAGWGPHKVHDALGEAVSVNVLGTTAVLQAAMQNSCRVIYVSCPEVYGKQEQRPLREDAECRLGPASESTWAFAAMKLMAELACLSCAQQGLPITILRLFDVYGPRDRSGLTQALLRLCVGQTEPALLGRSLMYVTDAVDALILASHSPSAQGHIINIGWDTPAGGKQTNAGGVGLPDTTKARALLGFVPRVTLEEGLALMRIRGL